MRTFSRSKLFLWALVHIAVIVLLTTFIPRIPLMTFLNGVFLGIVVAVSIVYAPLVFYTFRKGRIDRVSQLALGIGLIWTSIAGQRGYWLVWNAYGMPESWHSNPVLASLVYLAIVGGGLFVTAPGYPPHQESLDRVELWGDNRNLLLALGSLGGLLAFLISVYEEGII